MEEERESNLEHTQPQSKHAHESNLEYTQESASFSELVQESLARLENECLTLENEINAKQKSVSDNKEKNRIQAENISKLKLETEHNTMKLNNEIFNRESCNTKISTLLEKYVELEKHFACFNEDINFTQNSINKLTQLHQCMISSNKCEQESCDRLKQQYSTVIHHARQQLNKIEIMKEKEKKQFDEALVHLKNQIEMRKPLKTEIKAKLQEVKSKNREHLSILSLLESQNDELKNEHERLQNELAKEKMTAKTTIDELNTSLKKEQDKNEELKANIAASDQLINQTNNEIRDAENEIAAFETQLKAALSEQEELTKNYNNAMEIQNKLTLEAESLKERHSVLQKIDEENTDLRLKKANLESVNNNYNQNLAALDKVEIARRIEIKELKKFIELKEIERINKINEIQRHEDELSQLQAEMEHEACEHNRQSQELDMQYDELKRREVSLNKNLRFLTEQLSVSSEDKRAMETVVANMKRELQRAKQISEESEAKLFKFRDFRVSINNAWNVERTMLDEMLKKNKEYVEKAEKDSQLNKVVKEQISEKKILHAKQENIFAENIQKLEQDFANKIEVKNKSVEEIKVKYDKEYRNKEQQKKNALVELKENKARLSELQAQQQVAENAIKKKQDNLVKCSRFMRKLGSKLVATATSQASAQSTNEVNDPQLPRKDNKPRAPSPAGSSSSGMTFNPDDVNTIKRRKENLGSLQNKIKKPNLPQKKTTAAPEKLKKYDEKFNDWGF